MGRHHVPLIALAFVLSFPAVALPTHPVRISGRLLIYDVAGPIKWERGKAYKIRFSLPEPTSALSIPDEVGVDQYFRWVVIGDLLEDTAVIVRCTTDYDGFVHYNAPTEVMISAERTRVSGVRVILMSRERAKRAAFHDGNTEIVNLPILGPSQADADEVKRALQSYDRALNYVPDPIVYRSKADLLHRIGKFKECADTYRILIEILTSSESEQYLSLLYNSWLEKIACLRKNAEAMKSDEAWRQLAANSDTALQSNLPGLRGRFIANWLDALLVLTHSRGDFAAFAATIDRDEQLRRQWHELYYRHYKRTRVPLGTTQRETISALQDISRAIGRPY